MKKSDRYKQVYRLGSREALVNLYVHMLKCAGNKSAQLCIRRHKGLVGVLSNDKYVQTNRSRFPVVKKKEKNKEKKTNDQNCYSALRTATTLKRTGIFWRMSIANKYTPRMI